MVVLDQPIGIMPLQNTFKCEGKQEKDGVDLWVVKHFEAHGP